MGSTVHTSQRLETFSSHNSCQKIWKLIWVMGMVEKLWLIFQAETSCSRLYEKSAPTLQSKKKLRILLHSLEQRVYSWRSVCLKALWIAQDSVRQHMRLSIVGLKYVFWLRTKYLKILIEKWKSVSKTLLRFEVTFNPITNCLPKIWNGPWRTTSTIIQL